MTKAETKNDNSSQTSAARVEEYNSATAAPDTADGYQQPVIRYEEVFGATYVDWERGLLLAVGDNPEHVQYSGLVAADHKASAKRAWVCKGRSNDDTEGSDQPLLADSNCYRKFLEQGED